MRIAFISNHPAPYRDSFIAKLVEKLGEGIEVFSELPFDPGHSFWNLKPQLYSADVLVPNGVSHWMVFLRLLRRFVFGDYDIVFWPGLSKWYILIPMYISALLGKKFAFTADTVHQRETSWLARRIKSYIAHCSTLILVPGKAGRLFWLNEFGISSDKIIIGAYALDGKNLERVILERRKNNYDRIRNGLSIPSEATVYLMVANMIKTRCYPITSSAFIEFSAAHKDAIFIMVGSGPELEIMQALAKDNKCLRVMQGCSFERMLDLYSIADVYVHGGAEPASTALVIGAISNLPLISSMCVGCSYDCLVDGVTGFEVSNYQSIDDWKDAFERSWKDKAQWKGMGEKARDLSKGLDDDSCVEGLVAKLANI